MKIKNLITLMLISTLCISSLESAPKKNNPAPKWTKEQAKEWYSQFPWMSGTNFQPSSAINQVEMWSATTFDAATIDKELGWAEELGFNLMRVYLSSEVWKQDAEGFKKRINQYLDISNRHGIKTMFVFFDDCWNPETVSGKQPAPQPGVHNSGWVRDPAVSLRQDTAKLFPVLEKYVKDILTTFKNDKRILLWDLYNEPGNSGHGVTSLPLLKNVFHWARQINPSQPISVGVWYFGTPELNTFQVENSDIITYHNYSDPHNHQLWIDFLKIYDRPMICTEYMARRNNSYFQNIMPLLKRNNVGAINWGFVSGKTNTIFAWDEPRPNENEPPLWFHDIYRQDKTPFDPAEVEFIKQITGKNTGVKLINAINFNKIIDSKQVSLYTLKNKQGVTAQITNYGGRVVSLWVPDRENKFRDIVTGFNTIDEYLKANEIYFGALIGRYGNRIGNGEFMLNEKKYSLNKNNDVNHLHGGPKGFHNVVWTARPFKTAMNEDALELTYVSADNEEGYPGKLTSRVIYTLTDENELKVTYDATTDKPTPVNLTHHSFFNLHGFSGGVSKSINSHVMKINASKFIPTNEGLIPTGVIADVKGTPMDFRQPRVIGERVNEQYEPLIFARGYDHNWVIDNGGFQVQEAVVVYEPATGIQMRVFTDQPGVQFYGGNFLDGKDTGKYGEVYTHRSSIALETQHFPDSPNQPNFPNTILMPGEKYTHTCIYKFEVL